MKIFISHSIHDKWVAKQLSNQLESQGHVTFIDEKNDRSIDAIDSETPIHLKNSDHVIIVISPASLNSHWVFIEIGEAKALNKKIIPILINVDPKDVPDPITQLLARDINDFDTYLSEIFTAPDVTQKTVSRSAQKKKRNTFKIGEKVKIIEVEQLSDKDKARSPRWTPRMDKYSGIIATIIEFNEYRRAILDIDDDAKTTQTAWHTKWLLKVN